MWAITTIGINSNEPATNTRHTCSKRRKLPVLAAPTAGVPEVVTDGETGFLIQAQDAAGYATRMLDLLNNPELSRRVTEQAFARVIHVSVQRVVPHPVRDVHASVAVTGAEPLAGRDQG